MLWWEQEQLQLSEIPVVLLYHCFNTAYACIVYMYSNLTLTHVLYSNLHVRLHSECPIRTEPTFQCVSSSTHRFTFSFFPLSYFWHHIKRAFYLLTYILAQSRELFRAPHIDVPFWLHFTDWFGFDKIITFQTKGPNTGQAIILAGVGLVPLDVILYFQHIKRQVNQNPLH